MGFTVLELGLKASGVLGLGFWVERFRENPALVPFWESLIGSKV